MSTEKKNDLNIFRERNVKKLFPMKKRNATSILPIVIWQKVKKNYARVIIGKSIKENNFNHN